MTLLSPYFAALVALVFFFFFLFFSGPFPFFPSILLPDLPSGKSEDFMGMKAPEFLLM